MKQDERSVGRWVKRARLARGLTQDVLADRVGCATQTIRKIESGQRRPSFQVAQRLAMALELPDDERVAFVQAARGLGPDPASARVEAGSDAIKLPSIPTYLTPFVGREDKRAAIARLLASRDHRLVTLVGPGGIGKTRLAVEVAAQATGFADGVAFVALVPIREPQAIVPAIADALAFSFAGTGDLTTQLLTHLRRKELLLVLDNMEHLLAARDATIELVRQVLEHAPRVQILATSRERLRLQSEWVVEIEGLPVPPGEADSTDYPSCALFVEHARRVQHRFHPSGDDEQAIATICRLVGGMPLALELAAAWIRVLSPREISREMSHGLDSSLMSPQDLPERHRSLRAVFDHSWQLLSAAEQHALCKLSVFRGGCTRDAAVTVAGASIVVLATLVDKSLLRRTHADRYDLHELIRQYSLAKLQQNPDDHAATRDAHSAYYTSWLKAREHRLKGPQQAALVAELGVEIDNIRGAWEWAVSHRRLDDMERCAETLLWFFEFRGWFGEGEALFGHATEMLDRTDATSHGAGDAFAEAEEYRRVLAQVLANHGYLAARLGRLAESRRLLERSLALVHSVCDPLTEARALAYFGTVLMQLGEYRQSRQTLLEGVAAARATADRWTIANCLSWLSMVEHALGDYEAAERAFREGLADWRAIGNPRTTLFCITFCSITLYALGKYDEARSLLGESLDMSKATDDRWGQAMTLGHLGLIAYGQGEYREAVRLLEDALELLQTIGTQWELVRVLTPLGTTLAAMDSLDAAEQTYREALVLAVEARAVPDLLHLLAGLAALRVRERRFEAALELLAPIAEHPASRHETRHAAAELCALIHPQLSQEQIRATTEIARSRSWEDRVRALVSRP